MYFVHWKIRDTKKEIKFGRFLCRDLVLLHILSLFGSIYLLTCKRIFHSKSDFNSIYRRYSFMLLCHVQSISSEMYNWIAYVESIYSFMSTGNIIDKRSRTLAYYITSRLQHSHFRLKRRLQSLSLSSILWIVIHRIPMLFSDRQEAVDMLCDLAVRKLSPGTSNETNNCKPQSPGASCNSPRRRRLATRTPTAETDRGKWLINNMHRRKQNYKAGKAEMTLV